MRRMIGLLAGLLALSGCSKEEESNFPNASWMMADAMMDANGTPIQLHTDDGKTYRITNPDFLKERLLESGPGMYKDTLIRTNCVCILHPLPSAEATLLDAVQAFAPLPIPAEDFKNGVKTDPVYIRSIWKTDRYINLTLEPMGKDKSLAFHFADYGWHETHDGKRIQKLVVHHNQNGDYPAFRRTVYLSVPIWQYAPVLRKGTDSLEIFIRTFDRGIIRRAFLY